MVSVEANVGYYVGRSDLAGNNMVMGTVKIEERGFIR